MPQLHITFAFYVVIHGNNALNS